MNKLIQSIEWFQLDDIQITSLILWNHQFVPYQTIMLRKEKAGTLTCVFYFKIHEVFLGVMQTWSSFQTEKEEEKLFHLAFASWHYLESYLKQQKMEGEQAPPLPKQLAQLMEEAFISELGMKLIEEEYTPDFGFYSMSPNFKKIKKMLQGESFSILDFLKSRNLLK